MNFEGINNFNDFMNYCKDHDSGYSFEILCKYVLLCHFNFNDIENVYMYTEIPETLKTKLNLPQNDKGIDLLIVYKNKTFKAVQCKYRSNLNNTVSYTELSTYFAQLFFVNKDKQSIKGVYMTNTHDNCEEINKDSRIMAFNYDFFEKLDKEFFDAVRKYILDNTKPEYKRMSLRPYQKECVKTITDYFESNDSNSRCHTILPCGTGKSIVSFNIDKKMCTKKTLVLVPSLYLLSQIYNTYTKESYSTKTKSHYLLIGSDASVDKNKVIKDVDYTTNQTVIDKFLNEYNKRKIIIICTYQSSKLLEHKEFDLIIFDEAHRTVNQEQSFFNFALSDDNIKSKKRLFMTATKKVFKKDSSENEVDDSIICMNNKYLYGPLLFELSLREAIEKGYLCDYLVECMVINDELIKQYKLDNEYIKIEDGEFKIDDIFEMHEIASAFMIKKLFENGSINHLLTYHSTRKKAKHFRTLVENISGIPSHYMEGTTSCRQRNKIIREFKESKKSIICSARVLNEGVDIPIVDSVIFVNGRKSQNDIIQCIGRALRLYENKDVARILLPVLEDEIEDEKTVFGNIYNILKVLKILDTSFIDYFFNKTKGQIVNKKINYSHYNDEISENLKGIELNCKNLEKIIDTKIVDLNYGIENKIEELLKFTKIPDINDKFINGSSVSNFWLKCISNKILEEPYIKLLENDILREDYKNYKKNKGQLTSEQKAKEFLKYVEEHGLIAQTKEDKEIKFSNDQLMWSYWTGIKNNQIKNKKVYEILLKNEIIKNAYDTFQENKKKNLEKKSS
jgi:predicted helicase